MLDDGNALADCSTDYDVVLPQPTRAEESRSSILDILSSLAFCGTKLRPLRAMALFAVVLFPPLAAMAVGAEFRVDPHTDLKPLLKKVTAGDTLILSNGVWRDVDLRFEQLIGTTDLPIEIRAESPGKVVLSGKSTFGLSGNHVVVSGLVFRNPRGVSDVVQFRTHSKRHAYHCRMTDCLFEETAESDAEIESRWLSVYGGDNRIDHCYFGGKKNRGTTLVVWVTKDPQHHRIDHNHFGPRPELGANGGETIRIGTSDVSEFDSGTTVEQNYFHGCDGEAEIVSNKSCANIYRHNSFDECSGALTLRHGHRCTVDGNVFLGREKLGTGGVRIIGTDHTVINNCFEGLRGDGARAALSMMNGIPNSPLSGYAPVRNATVAHNTFVDCKISIEIGVGAGKTQSVAPVECVFRDNLFLPGKWPIFRVHAKPLAFEWKGNKRQVGPAHGEQFVEIESVDLQLQRGADGLLRPAPPAEVTPPWPSAANTGPLWRRK